ncbi:MAG TPA: META domain-containing protein [Nocardioidaceae bacterium]|nr:META domain-containing protein [Nocardioidaceae bacterium]
MNTIAALAPPAWLLAGALLAGAGACAQSPDAGTADTVQPSAGAELRLDGRTFASVHVTSDGAPVELVPGTQIRLSFSDGDLTASAGCNTMLAGTTYDEAVLRISDSLGMTEMGCDRRRQAQDEWLASVLTARPTLAQKGDGLTISRGGLVIELTDVEVLELDRRLRATRWRLQGFGGLGDESSVTSVMFIRPATLVFTGNGASISTGCSSGSANAAVSAGVVSFSDFRMTPTGCEDGRGAVGRAVMTVLRYPCRVDIAGSTLTLTSRAGTLSYLAA